MKLCKTEGCLNGAAPGRTICYKCKSRAYTKKNPVRMIWHWLKKSAKRRHLDFELSLEYLTEFLSKTNYVAERGRLRDQLTIDRRDGSKGYIVGNLKVKTKSENSAKYHAGDKEVEMQEDCPF